MTNTKGETVFLAGIMILGALMFYLTFDLPPSWYQPLGASVYARIILSILELLCLIVLLRNLGRTQKRGDAPDSAPKPDRVSPPMRSSGIIVFLYGLAVTFVGYFVSSFLFIVVLIFVLSARAVRMIPKAAAVGLLVMTTLYIFLKYFLNLYFPETWLF